MPVRCSLVKRTELYTLQKSIFAARQTLQERRAFGSFDFTDIQVILLLMDLIPSHTVQSTTQAVCTVYSLPELYCTRGELSIRLGLERPVLMTNFKMKFLRDRYESIHLSE